MRYWRGAQHRGVSPLPSPKLSPRVRAESALSARSLARVVHNALIAHSLGMNTWQMKVGRGTSYRPLRPESAPRLP